MRVPISWLKEYVDITMSPAELAELVTNAGMEVETVEYIGIEGAPLVWDREKVLLGQILKVEQHPNADTLVLATVDYGAAEPKVVVTGAPNLQPYNGAGDLSDRQLYGAIIFEGGTYLNPYKKNKPTVLKGKALRGIQNNAMLCSEVELAVGDDHDGIMIMEKDANTPHYIAGTPLQDILGDAVLDIDIIPNIARCASIIGIAREVAALTGQTLRYPSWDVVMEGAPVDGRVKLSTERPDLNPRFTAILIEGVEQKPSPFWMKRRLALAGQRSINVVVDISNYVMLEMGQPNHTFDFDFLAKRAAEYSDDGQIHVITRLANEGETLTTLDGKEHKLHPNNILVTDPAGNLSIGGIMGGLNSEIEDETTNVLLEAAAWNFINIRHSSRQLNLHTEAGFRFSRGVHPSQAILGAKRAAELLRTLAGGTVAQGIIDYYPAQPEPISVTLPLDYARKLSGLDLTMAEIGALLERLEFEITELADDHLVATVPDHRIDVEGKHDLVEEFCRVYGYGNIPSTVLSDVLPTQRGNPSFEAEARIKDLLVQSGMQEIITYRLTTREAEARALTGAPDDRPYVSLANPSTLERVDMRHNLLASVLDIAAENTKFVDRVAIFELGHVYIKDEEEILPTESPRMALALTGARGLETWQDGAPPQYDFYDMKGILDTLFGALQVTVRYESAEHPTFRPGRTAKIMLGKSQKQLGVMGELHPRVVQQYGMRVDDDQAVLSADLDLQLLLANLPSARKVAAIPEFPPVREDLALVVDATVEAAKVEAAIRKGGGYLLKELSLFDVYTGEHMDAGKKSLAYHLTFQSPSKTLKDKDIAKMRKKIVKTIRAMVGATLRQ